MCQVLLVQIIMDPKANFKKDDQSRWGRGFDNGEKLLPSTESYHCQPWDVSGFVRLFLILTKNKFLTENVR